MPKKFTMTWEPAKLRWRKMHRGKVYTISCDALGCAGTKEGSYRQANLLWESQFAQIKYPPTRFGYIIEELERRKAWLVHNNLDATPLDGAINALRNPSIISEGNEVRLVFPPDAYDAVMKPSEEVWVDRLSRFKQPPTDRTVGYWVDKFLAMRETEVKSGDLSVSTYESIKLCLDHFRTWLNPELPIDNLDADRWVEWYKQVQMSTISVSYKRKRFTFTRTFIAWLVEQGLIPGFASLFAKRYKFGATDKEVEPLAVEQVRSSVDAAKGILKLHLLLMLNTGMTQKDIADLKPAEYKDGRITRRRSKTAKRNTRVVSRKLWKVTRDLLDEFKQEGSHLLLTSTGKPWVRDELIDGKRKKTDAIRSIYRPTNPSVSLKQLRQTSGDLIMHKFGKHVADHFLAHGQAVVDAAYFSRDQKELDEAVEWLGKEYRIAD